MNVPNPPPTQQVYTLKLDALSRLTRKLLRAGTVKMENFGR